MMIDQKKDNIEIQLVSTIKEYVFCKALLENKTVCYCKVNTDDVEHTWTIASWFTNEDMQGRGIGKKTLAQAISCLYERTGIPQKIEYTWNGTNSYVLEWMERHFDAKCSCPIAVQKNQADDDWDSHRYNLDVDKTLKYFCII